MAALVAAIHFPETDGRSSWMAGTSPSVTKSRCGANSVDSRLNQMPALSSEALSFVRYDAKERKLFASFRGRRRRNYVYDGVPQSDYDALMAAESKGAWFNAHIRDHYPFREV
jgi:KTSC domain